MHVETPLFLSYSIVSKAELRFCSVTWIKPIENFEIIRYQCFDVQPVREMAVTKNIKNKQLSTLLPLSIYPFVVNSIF